MEITPMRIYLITQLIDGGSTTEYVEYRATSLSEALTMAERANAGQRTITLGIAPEDYGEATHAGITFNVADGLLL